MAMCKGVLKVLALAGTLLSAHQIFAHHSMAEWDRSGLHELSGEIMSVTWRNPHIRWTMNINGPSGEDQVWTMAGTSPNHLERRGLTEGVLQVGQRIQVVGHFSARRDTHFIVNSALLPDQTEVLLRGLGPPVEPHWPEAKALIGTGDWGVAEAEKAKPNGLFSVWRTTGPVEAEELSGALLPEAQAIVDAWDETDNWVLRCEKRGMPSTMLNPYPMEFVDEGDRILLRIEEHDNLRLIHMSERLVEPDSQPSSPLGFSVGHWQNEKTLVVETSGVNFPWYDVSGTPQSDNIAFVETFTLSDDELSLDYERVATDAATFTEPRVFKRTWIAIPGIEIKRFDMDCSDDAYL